MEAVQAEYSVIGGMLLDSSCSVRINLSRDDFLNEQLGEVYQAILDLLAGDEVVDIITVDQHLKDTTGRNWLPFLGQITNDVPSAVNAHKYADIVKDESQKRRAVQIAQELQLNVNDKSSVDEAIKKLMQINRVNKNYETSIQQAMQANLEQIDNTLKNGKSMGIRSGISKLDDYLGGFHGGDLIVIGARPAMGKTAFLMNLALNSHVDNGIISSEQDSTQIGGRAMAIEGGVSVHNMRNGLVNDKDFTNMAAAIASLKNRNIRLNDMPAPSLDDIRRQARKWKYQHNIKALFIDYLQRMKGDPKLPKHERVGDNAEGLKELARELNIPVIVLAQVKREVETRPDKRPYMSDLADSGIIEREADQILTLYRDEVYNENTEEPNIAEVIICKNRHGDTGRIKTLWRKEFMQFKDLEAYNWS